MKYKEALHFSMVHLACDPAIRFIGYGLKKAGAGGTLSGIDKRVIVETTVAEGLMLGMATGLSLAGLKPVVFIERMDFILNAMDAICNHLLRIRELSDREFQPAAIIRCVVGNSQKPLFTGPTHTTNYANMFRDLPNLNVFELNEAGEIPKAYEMAHTLLGSGISTMLIEFKDKI